MEEIKGRVLIARYHLDGHDRGILSIISAMRDAGIEVIYMIFSHPNEIVRATLEEDPDVVGVSSSLGQHNLFVSLLIDGFKNEGINVPIILGGIIPTSDARLIRSKGVKQVFGPGSTPESAVTLVKEIVHERYSRLM